MAKFLSLLCATLLYAPPALAQIPSDAIRRLVPGRPVERTMQGGDVHRYQVGLRAGEHLEVVVNQRGIDIVLISLQPDGRKISEVDSPNGAQGPEPISVTASTTGSYQLEVRSLQADAAPGRYEIRIEALLTARQYRTRLADERARDDAIVRRLVSQATPLRSVTPGSGFADLLPLKEILRDVRVVGLGEATHGTREFFQLRHRLVEFLVSEMGFTVLAMEGSYAAFTRINDYVLHGVGDRAEVLAGQGYWILDVEEVAALIDWLRAHNTTVPHDRKVRFVGIDANANRTAMDAVIAWLARVAPDRASNAEALFERIRQEDAKAIDFAPTVVTAAELADLYRLISYVVLNKARFASRTSEEETETMLHNLRLVAQFAEFNNADPVDGGGTRDGYMAENFQYIVNRSTSDARFVVLAHNAHISKRGTGRFPAMGSYLQRSLGTAYYALGFAFGEGEFQAQVTGEGKPRVRVFRLGPAPQRTIDWYLARAGAGNFIIDLKRLPDGSVTSQWLQSTQRMHWVGAVFSESWSDRQWTQPFVLERDFDGLVFIERTTAARPTLTGGRDGMLE